MLVGTEVTFFKFRALYLWEILKKDIALWLFTIFYYYIIYVYLGRLIKNSESDL